MAKSKGFTKYQYAVPRIMKIESTEKQSLKKTEKGFLSTGKTKGGPAAYSQRDQVFHETIGHKFGSVVCKPRSGI